MTTGMELRTLGTSDLSISRVGLGAWAIGGGGWAFGWGDQDDKESIAAIRHAVDKGINWIDTAAVYGFGHSEEIVGRAVSELPDAERPYVFTKCGNRWERDEPGSPIYQSLDPASIREECEASLRRLGIERIDLYQFHTPDGIGTPVEDSWATMQELIAEGKVRHGGVSNFDTSLLERCQAIGPITSLQPRFSLLARDNAATVLPWCEANDVGVIGYSPMHSGILTDSFSPRRVEGMDDGDWRRRSADFNEPGLSRNIALRDALRPIAERHGTSISSVAIAWTLSWSAVTGAIVGARRPEQIDGWIAGGSLALTEDDLDEIAHAIATTGAGQGPARP